MLTEETGHLRFVGAVVSVRGSVVDVRFDARFRPIYSLVHAKVADSVIEGPLTTRRHLQMSNGAQSIERRRRY